MYFIWCYGDQKTGRERDRLYRDGSSLSNSGLLWLRATVAPTPSPQTNESHKHSFGQHPPESGAWNGYYETKLEKLRKIRDALAAKVQARKKSH